MTRLEAIAFNAVGAALGETEEWLRLTDRQKVANAVLAAVREEIAEEIERNPGEGCLWVAATLAAAKIARGESL